MAVLGVSVTIDEAGLAATIARLRPLVSFDPAPLMEAIAELGVRQTEQRINVDKTAPDGTPWRPNRAGTDILKQTGQHLLMSLGAHSSAEEAVWGAAWEFAHIHQEGAVITPKTAKALRFPTPDGFRTAKTVTIPARPFVGLSTENRAEMEDLVTDHFGRLAR